MKKSKKQVFLSLIVALLMAFALPGCGAKDEGQQGQIKDGNQTQDKQTDDASALFPVTLTDGANRVVTIEKTPQRIVSLIPSNTEIAFALGLGDKIVGVTDHDDFPEEVANIEKVGGLELNLEKIVALEPDLVLANIYHKTGPVDVVSKLEQAGICVLVINDSNSFDEAYDTFRMIGDATGKSIEAENLIADMKARYAAIKEKASSIKEEERKKVWIEVTAPPDLYTTGKGTFIHEMLETIGAMNIAGDQEGWIAFTEEQVVALNPDVILINYTYIENAVDQMLQREGWGSIPAIINKQVYMLDEDIVSRPGPRLVDGLELIAKLVYPEVFQD